MKIFTPCLMLVFGLSVLQSCNSARPAPKPRTEAPRPVPQKNAVNIAWYNGERLMPVLEEAQRLNKPVFVEFNAVWCGPCKVMEEEVFTQPNVYGYLNRTFINFRSDFDAPAGKAIADIYQVRGLPSILFLDPKGVVLERFAGMTTGTTLLRLAESAAAKMKK
jgi:thioredoxin 1